jgi:hypothetical protein
MKKGSFWQNNSGCFWQKKYFYSMNRYFVHFKVCKELALKIELFSAVGNTKWGEWPLAVLAEEQWAFLAVMAALEAAAVCHLY